MTREPTPMVTVFNAHRWKKFYLREGAILPGTTGRLPLPVYEKVKDTCPWIKRAERGDVVK